MGKINEKDNKIKYDKKIMRLVRAGAIILSIPVIISIPLMFTTTIETPASLINIAEFIFMLGILAFWPMVILWIVFIDGTLYLKGLEKAGYEIPEDKNQYDSLLSNLPRKIIVEENKAERNKGSITLCIIDGIIALIFWGIAIKYIVQWYSIVDIGFFAFCLTLLGTFWAIGALTNYKQSDNRKYKNFFDNDNNRKNRTPFSNGIATIIILLVISSVCARLPFSMTEYVAKSRLYGDEQIMDSLLKTALDIIAENEYCIEEEWPESYKMLTEGVDFFEADWEDDLFTRKLLESMSRVYNVESINDIKRELKAKESHAFVTLTAINTFEVNYTYKWEYGKMKTDDGPWHKVTKNK